MLLAAVEALDVAAALAGFFTCQAEQASRCLAAWHHFRLVSLHVVVDLASGAGATGCTYQVLLVSWPYAHRSARSWCLEGAHRRKVVRVCFGRSLAKPYAALLPVRVELCLRHRLSRYISAAIKQAWGVYKRRLSLQVHCQGLGVSLRNLSFNKFNLLLNKIKLD